MSDRGQDEEQLRRMAREEARAAVAEIARRALRELGEQYGHEGAEALRALLEASRDE